MVDSNKIMNRTELEESGKKGLLVMNITTGDGIEMYPINLQKLEAAIIDPIDFRVEMESFEKIELTFVTHEDLADSLFRGLIREGMSEANANLERKEYLEDNK